MGIPHDSPARIAAGVLYELGQQSSEGHVYVPKDDLIQAVAQLLEVEGALVQKAISSLQLDEQVHVEKVVPLLDDGQRHEVRVLMGKE